MDSQNQTTPADDAANADRRAFLRAAGKFALTVPPAMTVLMSTAWANHEGVFHSNEGVGQEKQGNPPDGDNTCNNPTRPGETCDD